MYNDIRMYIDTELVHSFVKIVIKSWRSTGENHAEMECPRFLRVCFIKLSTKKFI